MTEGRLSKVWEVWTENWRVKEGLDLEERERQKER
jgi:hypothetical protein